MQFIPFDISINIPEGYKTIPKEQREKDQAEELKAMEKALKQELLSRSQYLFSFEDSTGNGIEASYRYFDPTVSGYFEKDIRFNAEAVIKSIQERVPGTVCDSSYSEELIDGRVFNAYMINVSINETPIITFNTFTRLFENYQLTFEVCSDTKENKVYLLDLLKNCKIDASKAEPAPKPFTL